MTKFEKLIYNIHLKVSRVIQNKPYKFRNNFENLTEDKQMFCKKLALFFNKHNHINVETFFKAPYEIYIDKPSLDLKFYTSLKACKLYFEYINKLNKQDINSQETKQFFQESALFVTQYCIDNKITFHNYVSYKETPTDKLNIFCSHLKSGNVSIYLLFMYGNFEKELKSHDKGILDFMLKDVIATISEHRMKFYNKKKETKLFFEKVVYHCKNKVDSAIG